MSTLRRTALPAAARYAVTGYANRDIARTKGQKEYDALRRRLGIFNF